MADLCVEFVDELYVVVPPDALTFGRSAELVVDSANPYLHRLVGSFVHHDGSWWLRNEGRRLVVQLLADDNRRSTLPPGVAEPLAGSGLVRFEAGISTYELRYRVPEREVGPRGVPDPRATVTREFGVVQLNDEQRAMLAALSEHRLRDPALDRAPIPANAEVAHRLGWSMKKFDRKLDYLCARLSDLGVPGLRGERGVEAVDRRQHLVDHVLRAGLVTEADLSWIDDA